MTIDWIITGGGSRAQSSTPAPEPPAPTSPTSESMESGPRQQQSQTCWTSSDCTGDTVPADDARDCCVGTNDGQSYGVGPGNCAIAQCIGELQHF